MDTPPPSRGARVPYLALKHVAGSDRPMFFSISEKKAINIDATGVLNDNCWATPQGWVLVRDAAASSTYLLDPHDRSARIPLPHLPEDGLPSFCTCVLSDHPDLADPGRSCLVLLIHDHNPIFCYCRIGDDGGGCEWVKHEYDIGTQALPDLGEGCSEKLVIMSVAACQGKFYFTSGSDGTLGVLEFSPAPVLSSIAVPDAMEEALGCRSEVLVESRQELFMVSLLSGMDFDVVYRVHVHRMDFSTQEWIEVVDDIGGGRAFLLSPWYFGASRSAGGECGLEPNCVYAAFPVKKRVMVFDVKSGTMMMQDLEEAPVANQALWLLPTEHQ